MTKSKLIVVLVSFVAWILPVYATAQTPGQGEFLQLRADDPRCGEGFACFQVGSYRPGADLSFERMLDVVNRGVDEAQHVTIAQFEAANPCRVLYARGRSAHAVNGVCERNGTRERVTFESFCDGRACARWPFARHVYRVPSVRILTPDERAEEMAREIVTAVDTETVPAPASLGANLRELIELRSSSQPPTDEHEVAVLTAMANALDRTSGAASTDMTFDAPEADAPPATDAAELAALRSQVERLTQERDEARGALDGRWPWWVTILACLIGMLVLFFTGRRSVSRARVEDEEVSSEPMVPKQELDDALERAKHADRAVDNLRAQIATIDEEREQAKLFRQMREEWQTTPGVDPAFTMNAQSVAKTLAAWLRLDALAKAWAKLEPAFVPEYALADGGLRAYVETRMKKTWGPLQKGHDEHVRVLITQRDGFERQLAEARKQPAAGVDPGRGPIAIERRTLALVNERVGSKINDACGEFAAITDGDAVSIEQVRAELRIVKRQKIAPIFDFLQRVHDHVMVARRELDRLLDKRETDDLSPVPGSIPIASLPREARVLVREEYPDLFGDAGLDDLAETSEATPIDPGATRIARNPLLEAEKAAAEGETRGDEPTVEVKNNGGRERRDTHRGIGFAAAEPPPPIAEPVIPPDGSSEGK